MPKPIKGSGRYMPGLDGLRAIAVFAVIAYHLSFGWASGGLLGVGMFFVLSGYLITDLLLAAPRRRGGGLRMKDFWTRRARRLLPPLIVMILVVVAWITLVSPDRLTSLRGDVISALLYVSNWWFIFHHVSYFASFGPPSPLGHLWSLAVEEQFYLVWPLLLSLGLRFARRRWQLILLTLAGAAASAITMAVIYQPGTDPSRVYYGTDTRAFGLLIGATLAMVWPSRKLAEHVPKGTKWLLDIIGVVGLVAVLWMIHATSEFEPFLYRGGLVVLCLATALLVASAAHPASNIGKILGWKPIRWFGVRSYGIYLWHFPVIVLTTPVVNTGGVNWVRDGLQVAVSIILAALSWRYIEEPIRHGAIGKLWGQIRSRQWRWGRVPFSSRVTSLSVLFTFGVSCVGMSGLVKAAPMLPAAETAVTTINPLVSGKSTSSTHESGQASKTTGNNHDGKADGKGNAGASSSHSEASGAGKATGSSMQGSTTGEQVNTGVSGVSVTSGVGVTAIGDSVMIDDAPYLEKLLPGIVIDAHVGRQMIAAPAVIQQLKADGELGSRVIIALGTNGPFTEDQLIYLLKTLGPVQQIILVNTRVPREWQDEVNQTLAEVAATFPHTTLVDWYDASANHNNFFYPDGVHLNPTGAQFDAALIAKAVEPAEK